jgi:hypothetical protein
MKLSFLSGLIFLGLSGLVGCGGTTTGTDGGSGGGGNGGDPSSGGGGAGNGGSGGSSAAPGQQSISFGPVTIQPGEENTKCIQGRLSNLEQLRVHQIHNTLTDGSHHLIIYRTNDTVENLTPYDCQPFVDTLDPTKGSPLMVTQKHEETLTLPEGVAFTLAPNQMIRLEVHYINPTSQPLEMKATADFIPIAEKDYKYDADFLFIGDPDIDIPAMSTQTLGPVYLPLGELMPGIDQATFFAITGHTHQWGTNVQVNLAQDATDPGTPVYDVANWSWSEPETVQHDPGFKVPASGGFKFSCTWNNKSPQNVGFGESANAEMCFFWAYYYPSQGAYVCAHSEQAPQIATDICCPGSPICDYVF